MRIRSLAGRAWSALVVLIAVLAGPSVLWSQEVETLPGFVDFESFGDFDLDDLTVEINLGNGLLKMLSGAVAEEDGEFGELLQGLRLIKVNIFEASGAKHAANSLRGALRELRRDGWETVVSIRDEENLHILLRTEGDSILGVLAAFSDDESFGLVNIVGNFDPEQIGRLARQLDIEPLEELDLSGIKRSRDDG